MEFKKILANYEERPIGLTKPPRLSWQSEIEQEYFVVNISKEFHSVEVPNILDTGKIFSNDCFYDCDELNLLPFTRYFWRVGVGNSCGEFAWSDVHEFVTSALNRSQWTAMHFRNFETVNVCMDRKEFHLDALPEAAYFFAAASGEKSNGYHIYVNGTQITKWMIMPGPLEYMTMSVTGYDITELISFDNVINVDHVSGFSGVIKLYFSDGSTQIIETDKSWLSYRGENPYTLGYNEGFTPTRHHGKYERFDKNKVPTNWYLYGEKNEKTSVPGGTFWGPINIRYSGVKTGKQETIEPQKIYKAENGYICDFGKIQSGFVGINVHNCKEKIKIQYAEHIEEGKPAISQYGNEYLPICEFLPMGLECEEYIPYFMHTSYRYIYIEGLDYEPQKDDFKAYFVYSNIDGKSKFSCSDYNLSYLDKCIRRSFRSCLVNVPTDCPGRERRGWTADSFAVIDSQCFMYNIYNIYERWFCDLHDNQRVNGWCCAEYPDQTDPCIDINWPMHIIINPWNIYEHYGDIRILKNNIENMEKYCELLYSLSDNHLFCKNLFAYGDWVAIEKASSDYLGIAFYYYVTMLLSKIEKKLGREELSIKYYERSEEIKAVVNRHYFNSEYGYYDTNTQSANTLALFFGFCKDKTRVFKNLTDDIEKRNMLTVGVFANAWLYQVLGENGRNDLAYRLLTDESVQGSNMLKMVNKLKNETLNENFTNIKNSLNHMFLGGGPQTWIYRCLMGLNPTKPGFKEYILTPYLPDKLNDLNVVIDAPTGRIGLSWSRVCGGITLTVIAPPNAVGCIILGGQKYQLTLGKNIFYYNNDEWKQS